MCTSSRNLRVELLSLPSVHPWSSPDNEWFAYFLWGFMLDYVQGLSQTLCSGITPDGFRGQYGMLGIEPILAACRINYPTRWTISSAPLLFFLLVLFLSHTQWFLGFTLNLTSEITLCGSWGTILDVGDRAGSASCKTPSLAPALLFWGGISTAETGHVYVWPNALSKVPCVSECCFPRFLYQCLPIRPKSSAISSFYRCRTSNPIFWHIH